MAKLAHPASASLIDFGKLMADSELGCAAVAADQQLVVLDVPPLRKAPAK